MSKLLIPEPPLQVLPSLAVEIGLNEAIFVQQLHYLLLQFGKEQDGHRWVYNTYEEWGEVFPFWAKNTIVRTIKNLEDRSLVLTANYNKMPMDRTKWYTIDYSHFGESSEHLPKMGRPSTQNGLMSSTQNGFTNNQRLPETTKQETNKLTDSQSVGFSTSDMFRTFQGCGYSVGEIRAEQLEDLYDSFGPLEMEYALKQLADTSGIRKPVPYLHKILANRRDGIGYQNGESNGTSEPILSDEEHFQRSLEYYGGRIKAV